MKNSILFNPIIGAIPLPFTFNTINDFNNLLTLPTNIFPANASLVLDLSRPVQPSIQYQYNVNSVGGSTAQVMVEIFYATTEDLATMNNAVAAKLTLTLPGDVTLSGLRAAEATIAYLLAPSSSTGLSIPETVAISALSFFGGAAIFMFMLW